MVKLFIVFLILYLCFWKQNGQNGGFHWKDRPDIAKQRKLFALVYINTLRSFVTELLIDWWVINKLHFFYMDPQRFCGNRKLVVSGLWAGAFKHSTIDLPIFENGRMNERIIVENVCEKTLSWDGV